MTQGSSNEKVIVIHHANTHAEAAVIRGLLASAGISSPDPTDADIFPLGDAAKGFTDTDILVLASEADEARELISRHFEEPEIPS